MNRPVALPFLSEAWVAEFGRLVAATVAPAGGAGGQVPLVMQHVVDDVAYWIELAPDGAARCEAGRRADATITYTTPRAVARAVAAGERTPAEAFMAGDVKVAGDIGAVLTATGALERIAAASAALRPRTDFS